ncbi:MAG: Pyridoxamine 5-phosphate oxidase [Candidatus Parcubacteria bacterium]|jgi:uncharacterized protein YhbP (UPF0306 family)
MNHLLSFLQSHKLLALATTDASGAWIANVYATADEKGTMYFVSSENTRHSQMILKNPSVAFSMAWFDPMNHKNRKGVQGTGICRPAQTDEEITKGIALHNAHFPEFKDRITVVWIKHNERRSKVWLLTPDFVKYWDDEVYGEDENKEFIFNRSTS